MRLLKFSLLSMTLCLSLGNITTPAQGASVMIQNDMERVIKNKKNLELKTPEGAPDTSLIDANETPDVFQFLMNDNQLEPNASIPMPAPLPENMDDNLIVRPVIPSLQKDKATPQ